MDESKSRFTKIRVSIEGSEELRVYDILEKEVKRTGHSGRIYVPPSWIGKRVKIILLDPLDEVDEG